MSITRRLFLRQSAAAGAVGAVVTVPAAAEPELTPLEWAIWHLREIERLMIEDGADAPVIMAVGTYGHHENVRLIGIRHGNLINDEGMFGGEQS